MLRLAVSWDLLAGPHPNMHILCLWLPTTKTKSGPYMRAYVCLFVCDRIGHLMHLMDPHSAASWMPALSSLIVLFAASLLSIPAGLSAVRRLTRPARHGGSPEVPETSSPVETLLYRDEDGSATDESSARFSDKRQRVVVMLASVAGLGASFALMLSHLSTSKRGHSVGSEAVECALWVSDRQPWIVCLLAT